MKPEVKKPSEIESPASSGQVLPGGIIFPLSGENARGIGHHYVGALIFRSGEQELARTAGNA